MKNKVILSLLGMLMATSLIACGSGENDSAKKFYEFKQQNSQTEAETEVESEKISETQTEKIPETQSETGQEPVEADLIEETGTIVGQYGYNGDGYSNLSFTLVGDSLVEDEAYYIMDATLLKPAMVPANLRKGQAYTLVRDELEGKTLEITYQGDGKFIDQDGMEYYVHKDDENSTEWILYCGSDDRVDVPFFKGRVRIKKDAVTGVDITKEYRTVTKEELMNDGNQWFNGVMFDGRGIITRLVFFGD